MKKGIFYILFFVLTVISSSIANALPIIEADTIIKNKQTEEQIIEEVIKNGTEEQKDKLQYLSKVTKYGFKDLFKHYTYNPQMSYSSQINPYAESYMQDYLKENTNYLMELQKTGRPYFNLIDNILVQYGLPKELKYLAVIESNLKSTALSKVGARGPWQFMPYTAKDFGLQVNSQVDDRVDYSKSTNAAAKYLLVLYKDLHDWLLVIAAYNGGPGRVYEAIKKSNSRNFWKLQYYLPTESRNHVKKFIATHYIMEASDASVVTSTVLSEQQKKADSIVLSGKYNASIIAKNVNIDQSVFNQLNGNFQEQLSKGEDAVLRLPHDKMQIFLEKKYSILDQSIKVLLSGSNGVATKPITVKKTTTHQR